MKLRYKCARPHTLRTFLRGASGLYRSEFVDCLFDSNRRDGPLLSALALVARPLVALQRSSVSAGRPYRHQPGAPRQQPRAPRQQPRVPHLQRRAPHHRPGAAQQARPHQALLLLLLPGQGVRLLLPPGHHLGQHARARGLLRARERSTDAPRAPRPNGSHRRQRRAVPLCPAGRRRLQPFMRVRTEAQVRDAATHRGAATHRDPVPAARQTHADTAERVPLRLRSPALSPREPRPPPRLTSDL